MARCPLRLDVLKIDFSTVGCLSMVLVLLVCLCHGAAALRPIIASERKIVRRPVVVRRHTCDVSEVHFLQTKHSFFDLVKVLSHHTTTGDSDGW